MIENEFLFFNLSQRLLEDHHITTKFYTKIFPFLTKLINARYNLTTCTYAIHSFLHGIQYLEYRQEDDRYASKIASHLIKENYSFDDSSRISRFDDHHFNRGLLFALVENFCKNLEPEKKDDIIIPVNLRSTILETFYKAMIWENRFLLFYTGVSLTEKKNFKITFEPNSILSPKQLLLLLYSHFFSNPLIITNGEKISQLVNNFSQRLTTYLNGLHANTDLDGWICTSPNPVMIERATIFKENQAKQ